LVSFLLRAAAHPFLRKTYGTVPINVPLRYKMNFSRRRGGAAARRVKANGSAHVRVRRTRFFFRLYFLEWILASARMTALLGPPRFRTLLSGENPARD